MTLVVVFALGHLSAHWFAGITYAQAPGERSAYLIAATNPVSASADRMAEYGEVAGALARRAGMEMLGVGTPGTTVQVLEGAWPYEGRVVVEKYRSMKALLDFWHSDDYQRVRQLRTAADFIIALEAVE